MLLPGTRLGSYAITGRLGSGGMGEVFRATDLKLGRDVAIKTLPDAFARDPVRLARLEREAHLLASMNHPNIAGIYGIEDGTDVKGLVLELVEGPTLADRLVEGPLPIDQAVDVAKQMVDALDAAHEAGIVHRDLKPANVKIRPDGTVKVLDFGLAKATHPVVDPAEMSQVRTKTDPTLTREGLVMGTAAYMSPEQVVGKPADKRTDIWAFGAVLYEMLTGLRAFPGEHAAECMAAVLHRDPDFDRLPESTPPGVASLVKRCLVKDRRERLRDIGDARIELAETDTATAMPAGRVRASFPRSAVLALAGLTFVLTGTLVWQRYVSTSPAAPATRLALRVTNGPEVRDFLASSPAVISPDGGTLVYAGRSEDGRYLYRRALDAYDVVQIPGTRGAESPFFSFDGRWIGFRADGQLKKVPLAGGEPISIAPAPALLLGVSWGPDDTITFANSASAGLWRVSADGGTPEALTAPDVLMTAGHRFPYQLPDERGVLFSVGGFGGSLSKLSVLPAGSQQSREVRSGEQRFSGMRYLPTGHLVYGSGGTIFAGAFDLNRLAFTSDPKPVVSNVASSPVSQHVAFSVSNTGTLVYVPAAETPAGTQLVWLNPAESVQPITDLPGATASEGLRVSPDEDRVAVVLRTAGVADVWSYGLDRGDLRRVTRNVEAGLFAWMPGNQGMTVAIDGDLYTVAGDGTGEPQLLLRRDGMQVPQSWSGDGRQLLFSEAHPETQSDLFIYAPDSQQIMPLVETRADERSGALSRDGRFVAYVSDETGQPEVYLQSVDGVGERLAVSVDGGDAPLWSNDGSALYFARGRDLMRVTIEEPLRLGRADVVVTAPEDVDLTLGYTVKRDGTVLAARSGFGTGGPTEFRVVLNWFSELKRLVPVN